MDSGSSSREAEVATADDCGLFVAGEPALLLSRGEAAWRTLVSECGLTDLRQPRFQFLVSSWLRRGNAFDLDNLVHPVLSAIAAQPADLQSVWATVTRAEKPGVWISDEAPPPPPADATGVVLSAPPSKSMRTQMRLPELNGYQQLGTDQALGCSLILGRDVGDLVFGFQGPIKATIDALWPLLGGEPHRPADHRIRELRVARDPARAGMSVALWPLAPEPTA